MNTEKTIYKYKLDKSVYLELWKWFQEDAAKIKERMWTIATFFYTLLGGTLGFIAKDLLIDNTITLSNPPLVLVISSLALVISAYGIYMIRSYGWHIQSSWDRASFIRTKIEGLTEIWYAGKKMEEGLPEQTEEPRIESVNDKRKNEDKKKKKEQNPPAEAKRLIQFMSGFMIIYFIIFIWTSYQLIF